MNPAAKLFLEKLIHKAFPEFSNKVTWSLIMLGTAILVMPAPTYLLLLNLIIEFYNKRANQNINMMNVNDITPSTGVAITLIISGLVYHIIIKGLQLYPEILKEKSHQIRNDKLKKSDIQLYEKFISILPTNSLSIELLKDQDFAAPYHNNYLKDIQTYTYTWGKADHHFHDSEIEKKSIFLFTEVKKFSNFLGQASGFIGASELLSIPTDRERAYDWDWSSDTYKKIEEANKWSTDIHKSYCDFIATCKKNLLI